MYCCSLRPTHLVGIKKTGKSAKDAKVICHESVSIAIVTSRRLNRLLTTPESVDVNACWAPITSELSLEISAPVWVRVKKAIDCFCTCSNTIFRRSKIKPSPILDENHLPIMLNTASKIAISATTAANLVTKLSFPGITPSSISCFISNGVAIIKKASIMTVIINRLSETL